MKVSELIEMLQDECPTTEVYIFTNGGRKPVTELWKNADAVMMMNGD